MQIVQLLLLRIGKASVVFARLKECVWKRSNISLRPASDATLSQTLLSNKVACLIWQVAQLLPYRSINLPNRNHLNSQRFLAESLSCDWPLHCSHVILALLIVRVINVGKSIIILVLILVLKSVNKTFIIRYVRLFALCFNHLAYGAVIRLKHWVWGCSRWQASLCLFLTAGWASLCQEIPESNFLDIISITGSHVCLAIVCRWKFDSCLGKFVAR